jgi:2-polyprenyl-3-methyl-5-hydroxy-6-metoxy-1,4-benzoquinol methylase
VCLCKICSNKIEQECVIFQIHDAPVSAQNLPTINQYLLKTHKSPLELFQCSYCGHYQLCSEPVSYWREVITAAGLSPMMRAFRRKQFSHWIKNYNLENKEIVEFGCGEGLLLDILSECKTFSVGIEAGRELATKGQQKGRNIIKGHLLDNEGLASNVGAFICINHLEHIPLPLDFMRQIKACCIEGAIGILEVPNFEKDIAENKSYNLIRDHLSYFTKRTLSLIIQLAGFEILSLKEVWHGDDLEAIIQVPNKTKCFKSQQGVNVVDALNYTFINIEGSVAIWGASHQALTLLAMTHSTNVKWIADSAVFKQGKVDPIRGIPIVSPDEMLSKKPENIIVLAAGYSNEIRNILIEEKEYLGSIFLIEDIISNYKSRQNI